MLSFIALNILDTGSKLNVHKTLKTRPGRLLKVLCTFNLRPVSRGKLTNYQCNSNGITNNIELRNSLLFKK